MENLLWTFHGRFSTESFPWNSMKYKFETSNLQIAYLCFVSPEYYYWPVYT